jgi:hypothetical protein
MGVVSLLSCTAGHAHTQPLRTLPLSYKEDAQRDTGQEKRAGTKALPPPSYTSGIQEQGRWNADGTFGGTFTYTDKPRSIAHGVAHDSSRGRLRRESTDRQRQAIEATQAHLKKVRAAINHGNHVQAQGHLQDAEQSLGSVQQAIAGSGHKHTFFLKKPKKTTSLTEALAHANAAFSRMKERKEYGTSGNLSEDLSAARTHIREAQKHLNREKKKAKKEASKSSQTTPIYKRYWPQGPTPRMF